MPEATANLSIRKENEIYMVEFEDRKILEELTITQINEKLTDLVSAEQAPKLLLSFRRVEHMSSAALGVLININKQVTQRHGQLVLANIHPQIYEIFKITKLNRLFNIQGTTAEALRAFT